MVVHGETKGRNGKKSFYLLVALKYVIKILCLSHTYTERNDYQRINHRAAQVAGKLNSVYPVVPVWRGLCSSYLRTAILAYRVRRVETRSGHTKWSGDKCGRRSDVAHWWWNQYQTKSGEGEKGQQWNQKLVIINYNSNRLIFKLQKNWRKENIPENWLIFLSPL